MSNFDSNALFRVKCHTVLPESSDTDQTAWNFFFFCGENATNNKLNAATLHVYVYISSQCPNFDRQLWASVPTAASVTHCRPDCIFIQTQLTATEFVMFPPPPSLCLLKLFLPLTVSAITLLYISASPIPGDTISPWEYIMGANVIISSISSRLYTFFSNFKTSYLTFCWGRGGLAQSILQFCCDASVNKNVNYLWPPTLFASAERRISSVLSA